MDKQRRKKKTRFRVRKGPHGDRWFKAIRETPKYQKACATWRELCSIMDAQDAGTQAAEGATHG